MAVFPKLGLFPHPARGGALRRWSRNPRPASKARLAPLQIGGYFAEGAAQIGADRAHDGDGGNCDKCRDQPIFNRSNAAFIPDKTRDQAQHLSSPLKSVVAVGSLQTFREDTRQ